MNDSLIIAQTITFVKKELKNAFDKTTDKNTKYGYCNDWIFTLRENMNKPKKQNNKK